MPSVPWRNQHSAHADEHQTKPGRVLPSSDVTSSSFSSHSASAEPTQPIAESHDAIGKSISDGPHHSPSPPPHHASSSHTSSAVAKPIAKLRVQVIGARKLTGKDRNGKSDPFFFISLPGAPPISSASRDRHFYRRQTPVQAKTLDPTWSEEEATFDWDITTSWFRSLDVEDVKAIDHATSEGAVAPEHVGPSEAAITSTSASLLHVPAPDAENRARPALPTRPSNVRKISAVTGRMLAAPVRMTTKSAKATTRAVRKHGRPRPIRLRKGQISDTPAGSGALDLDSVPTVSAIEFVCWDKDRWSGNDYMGETSLTVPNWVAEGKSADWQASEINILPLGSSRRNAKVSGEILIKVGIVSLQAGLSADDIYAKLLEANSRAGNAAIRSVPADQSVGTAGPSEAFVDDGMSSGSESEAQEELLTDDEDDHSVTSDDEETTMTEDTDDAVAYDSDQSLSHFPGRAFSSAQRPSPPLLAAPSTPGDEEVHTEPDSAPQTIARQRKLFPHRLRKVRSSLKDEGKGGALSGSSAASSGLASGVISDADTPSPADGTGAGTMAKRKIRVRRKRVQKEASGESTDAGKVKVTRKQRRRAQREARERRQDFAFKAAHGKDIIGIVQLEVKQAEDLPRWRNSLGTSFDMDPFVIVSFGHRIFRTRVARHTLNPTWDEKLLFHVRRHEANFVTKFVVYDWDKLSANDYVCESEINVSDLIEEAPKPESTSGLYSAADDAMHQMKTFVLPLARNEDASARHLGKHSPSLTVQARFTPYAALRQRFWRQMLLQYDTNDSGSISVLEMAVMLDSLGSTLTQQTLEGFFTQFNKNLGDELSIDEAIVALESEIVKPYSQKRIVSGANGLDMLAGGTPMSGAQTPAAHEGSVQQQQQQGSHSSYLDLPSSSVDISGPQAPTGDEQSLAERSVPVSSDAVDAPPSKGVFARPIRTDTDASKLSVQSALSTGSSTKRDTSVHSGASTVSISEQENAGKDGQESSDEGQVERLIKLKNCPMCHMPRLSKKAEMDIVTHLAVCASQDWRRVDSLMVGNYVTAMQAHRKWVTRVFSKLSSGQYQLGANSANIIVQNRMTGELLEEKMQVYVRLGIRLLYKGARSRMEGARIRRMLKNMSVKQGIKFDSPASAREIPHFIAFHSLNMDEVREPIESFKTFNEFFYRKLKEDARPVADADDPNTLVSAADCRLMAFSSVTSATQIWIKGRDFTVERLLGTSCSKENLPRYADGGGLLIFRLAPQDYHRFHCPADAKVGKISFIDGQYYTVNPMAIRSAIDVYGENVRAVVAFHSKEFGTFYAVCIGAMMVGSIRMSISEGDEVQRGQEMGYFAFGGSTIVIVFEENRVNFDEDLLANSNKAIETLVRVGMRIGRASQLEGGLENSVKDSSSSLPLSPSP